MVAGVGACMIWAPEQGALSRAELQALSEAVRGRFGLPRV